MRKILVCAILAGGILPTAPLHAADQAVSRDGRFRYTIADGEIRQFRIVHGRSVPLSPAAANTDRDVDAIALAPSGQFLYALEGDYFDVDQFRVGKNGALIRLHPFLAHADAHPTEIVFHPNGRCAYVLCSHGAICQYHIERNGRLIPLHHGPLFVSENGQRNPFHLRFTGSDYATVTVDDTKQIPLIVYKDGTLDRTYER